MTHPLAALWGVLLIVTLVADIVAYRSSDQATVTATTRQLLAGPHKARNFWGSFVVGGFTVWATGWYEKPPASLNGALAWWGCSVGLFALMFSWAADTIARGRLSDWLGLRWGVLGSGIRQCVFGFSIGGLTAHFGF